jgi:hypothetical protein
MSDPKKPKNDHRRVHDWPEFHWNIVGFVCACIPTLAAILVSLDVLSVRAAIGAAICAIAYVVGLTWYFALDPEKPKAEPTE